MKMNFTPKNQSVTLEGCHNPFESPFTYPDLLPSEATPRFITGYVMPKDGGIPGISVDSEPDKTNAKNAKPVSMNLRNPDMLI